MSESILELLQEQEKKSESPYQFTIDIGATKRIITPYDMKEYYKWWVEDTPYKEENK